MHLTVKPIKKKDAGRGNAAIPSNVICALDIEDGDYIFIKNPDNGTRTIARAFEGYADDEGKEVVSIDGELRQEIGVSRRGDVEVDKATVEKARKIGIALPEQFDYKGDIKPHLRSKLQGRTVEPDTRLDIQLGFGGVDAIGEETEVFIVGTDPKETEVLITDSTGIAVSDKPLNQYVSETSSSFNQSTDDSNTETDSSKKSGSSGSGITYEDIGGLDGEIARIREMIEMPLQYPQLFHRLGIDPPKGVLLHGPPGTGKTMIAKAVANEVDASFHHVSGPEIMSDQYGQSEEELRNIFEEAAEESPSIIFMDEIDSIAPSRDEVSHDASNRVVAQLLSEMDGLEERGEVIVVGATNRPDSIDPALRRGGRFDREIEIGVPDKDGRKEILHIHTREMPLADSVGLDEFAQKTHGFVGADLDTFTKEAAMSAVRRIRPKIDLDSGTLDTRLLYSLEVTQEDFKKALSETTPSAMREVFVETPNVSWNDVGGLQSVKQELQESVQWPLDYDFLFDEAGVSASSGILLYGPPGTGKTLMAKAAANESEANFISIDGPEVMSKWVGEAEERIREVFEKARSNSPAVVFFDEIDSIAGQRGQSQGSDVTERVVSQLLTEMDGLEELENVVVIATTNRPDLVDSALRRSGRFSKEIEVGAPGDKAREEIFKVHLDDRPITPDVSGEWLAEQTDGYVGADIEEIVNEAGRLGIREFVRENDDDRLEERADQFTINRSHFERALDKVESSIDDENLEHYEGLNVGDDGSRPDRRYRQ